MIDRQSFAEGMRDLLDALPQYGLTAQQLVRRNEIYYRRLGASLDRRLWRLCVARWLEFNGVMPTIADLIALLGEIRLVPVHALQEIREKQAAGEDAGPLIDALRQERLRAMEAQLDLPPWEEPPAIEPAALPS